MADSTGGARPTPRTAADRRDDGPLVRVCSVLLALAAGWFLVTAVHPVGPSVLLWITLPFSGPVVSRIFWQTSTAANLPIAARRFWRRMSPAPTLVALGQSAQGVDVLSNPDAGGPHLGPVMLLFDTTALLIIIYALLRLPTGARDRGASVRIMLDASTVALAVAVFFWHFQTRSALAGSADRGGGPRTLVTSLALVVLALIEVFVMVRAIMGEHRVIDREGLRLLAAAVFVGALADSVQPLVSRLGHDLYANQVSVPLVLLFAGKAAARQRRAVLDAPRAAASRVRPFSLLPYTAVVAVDALLLWVGCGDPADIRVVAAAAVTLTGVVVVRQITALRDNGQLLGRLEHGATHDALTGLANRVLFRRRLQQALAAGHADPVGVVLVDLDGFKEVNDTLGHEVGDQLLIEVAERFSACVRSGDTVARLGGDEFVLVLPDASPAVADAVVDRMIESLRRPVVADGHELTIRASLGITEGYPDDDPSVLLRRADIAMYAAKTVSGTVFLRHHHGMNPTGSDHSELVTELRAAIDDDQLFLLYQPIVNLGDGRLIGAEALVRWAHPTRGVLTPDVFLPAAERSGLIVPLGQWVIRTAIRQLAQWPAEPPTAVPASISINLSARELREPDLVTDVSALLRTYRVDAAQITFEITESMALSDAEALATLRRLRDLGVRLSLDDFGTGYSTLSLLHSCPVDEIKLDRQFTQAPLDGRISMAAAVIHLARALGLHPVAEGIESDEQAQRLLALGYTAAQGYLFARPIRPEQFADLFTRAVTSVPLPPG